MNPNRSQHSALTEIESRISVLERRLKNAKSARNSYVDYLRGKYPAWKPSLPTYNRKMNRDDHLVGHLATSSYHWEGNRLPIQRPAPPPAHFYSEIPRRGPFLESDFARTRERLGLMSQQLRLLRDARMNMSTEDYFRSRSVRMRNEYYEEEEVPSLDGVRKRLTDMTFSLLEPPSTPTMEKIEEMQRLEAREKLIKDIRNGVLPSVMDTIEQLKVEEPKKEEPRFEIQPVVVETSAVSQPRIHFADTKPAPVISAPVPAPVISAPKEPEPVNAYSRIMGLLNKTDSDDSEDVQVAQPVLPAPIQKKTSEPQPVLGSLSQYLNKGPSSSAKPMFAGYTGGSSKKEESDSDDFFD